MRRTAATLMSPRRRAGAATRVFLLALTLTATLAAWAAPAMAASGSLRVLGSAPETWDAALQGDQGTATTLAQVNETLTAIDAAGVLQPALASSWQVAADGLSVVFHLRPNLVLSDGSPLTADDVTRSWKRLLDPAQPSPLASLLDDVVGARAYLSGSGNAADVGIAATAADEVTVRFQTGGGAFPLAVASPSFAVVPRSIGASYAGPGLPAGFVGSGAYVPVSQDATSIRLQANPHYWAGSPSIGTVELVTDTQGKAPVQAFED
ncbi:MAG TPA: ABC transporter substrate-binding protein, partial [Candidatus Dormibacteraeota bacterium]|nr:ABC transporter substrate-binding protein [Candidatus Dormibacteraeota bacterium]